MQYCMQNVAENSQQIMHEKQLGTRQGSMEK